jgi:hypothetical protein
MEGYKKKREVITDDPRWIKKKERKRKRMIPRLISFYVTSKAARRKRLWGDASRIWDKGCLVYRRRRGIIHRYYYESKRERESRCIKGVVCRGVVSSL